MKWWGWSAGLALLMLAGCGQAPEPEKRFADTEPKVPAVPPGASTIPPADTPTSPADTAAPLADNSEPSGKPSADSGTRDSVEAGDAPPVDDEVLQKLLGLSRSAGGQTYLPAKPPSSWTRTSSRSLNKKILEYCAKNLGKSVGRGQWKGECAELVIAALLYAGAKSEFPSRKGTKHSDDYVFGDDMCTITAFTLDKVNIVSQIQPGDLLQIRSPGPDSPLCKGKTTTGGTYTKTGFHHSAVVQAVGRGADSGWIMTYDQNVNKERWIHEGRTLKIADLQPGSTVWVYRARAK